MPDRPKRYGDRRRQRDKPLAIRFTADDHDLLGWIGRVGAVQTVHVMARSGRDRRPVGLTLQRLAENGFLTSARLLSDTGPLFVATRSGLTIAGLEYLNPAEISIESAHHQIAVAWLALELEREHSADHLIFERELRADPGHWAALRHRPDCVIETSADRGIAIEVELSIKSPARLDDIMRAYAGSPAVDAVRYYAGNERVRRALSNAVARTGSEALVEIRRWERGLRAGR
ncbi:MAG: hypothetical protein ACR2HD_03590 [Solirubrobacteraceae bacterium]|nr:MAG: hypothetical protein DLM63_11990 [Solirubrobacterales bacterium]